MQKLATEPPSLCLRSVTVPLRTVAPGHEHDMWLDVKQSGASNQWTVGKVLAAAVGGGGGDASGRVGTGQLNPEQCAPFSALPVPQSMCQGPRYSSSPGATLPKR